MNTILIYIYQFTKWINDLFQADLTDMQNLSRYIDGYRYIITLVDVFLKRAFALAVKYERGSTIANAFEIIFTEAVPNMLQTDRGTTFFEQRITKRISEIQCTSLLESEWYN